MSPFQAFQTICLLQYSETIQRTESYFCQQKRRILRLGFEERCIATSKQASRGSYPLLSGGESELIQTVPVTEILTMRFKEHRQRQLLHAEWPVPARGALAIRPEAVNRCEIYFCLKKKNSATSKRTCQRYNWSGPRPGT